MGYQEEKRDIIAQFARQSKSGRLSPKLAKQLHALLLKDTNKGRLYKYRACTSYSLDNLKNGTIYCPHPLSFNDPFDCRFGTTIESYYEDKIDVELDTIESLFNHLKAVLDDKSCLARLPGAERKVISKLSKEIAILSFFRKCASQIKSENVFQSICKKNPNMAIHIMDSILQQKECADSMFLLKKLFPDIKKIILENSTENTQTLEEIAIANEINMDIDEIALCKEIAKKIEPASLLSIDELGKHMTKAIAEFNKRNADSFIIGCLTTDNKNRLMWSHYAKDHQGFCIEYDFTDIKTLDTTAVLPIVYAKERPRLPFKPNICKTNRYFEEATKLIIEGLLTKDDIWSYENEWRIMMPTRKDQNLPMPKITCVYLGAQISDKDKQEIIKIAKSQGIPVKQMVLDRGIYELHAEDVIY